MTRSLEVARPSGELDLTKPIHVIPRDALPPVVRDWLAAVEDRSPNTFDSYHRAVSSWIIWCLRHQVDPLRAELEDAEAWARWLKADPGPSGIDGGGMTARSANVRLSACSSFYRRLVLTRRVEFNPFAAVVSTSIGTDRLRTPALSQAQVKKVMRTAQKAKRHPADLAVLELLFTTAARASEIANANLGDVQADDVGLGLRVVRKGRKEQLLPLTGVAHRAITEANKTRPDLGDKSRPLLLAPRGGRYSRHTISRLVNRYAKLAGLPPELVELVTAHTTRRTAITAYVDGGGDLRTAQTLAGHSDPRTTEGYIRAKNDRLKHMAVAAELASKFAVEDDD
jgi:integrase/recombinase XerD